MEDIDSVPSNVQSARQEALLYVFEDNEAVIEMIMKGKSPTMRHVSRTHRVALDWLFDRTYLDSKLFIMHVSTNNIVLWKRMQINADWYCFKTPVLQEILKIKKLLQVENCAFWEVIRLFQ